jgi:hypothetical protein
VAGDVTFTLAQLGQIFLAICGAIITVGGAWTVIKKAREPEAVKSDTIRKHGELLANDNKRLTELEDSTKIMMRSMLAIMSHELDGNHVEQLKKAKEDLEAYLISR